MVKSGVYNMYFKLSTTCNRLFKEIVNLWSKQICHSTHGSSVNNSFTRRLGNSGDNMNNLIHSVRRVNSYTHYMDHLDTAKPCLLLPMEQCRHSVRYFSLFSKTFNISVFSWALLHKAMFKQQDFNSYDSLDFWPCKVMTNK